ncbi:MAG: peroxiredoxin family protein [Mycolicibacterium sp.]|uniref:peroxiredoxin family protein n=1 Tax=Mycolicibacterium sp. TaxID=2320850 RepID=UPI003D120072
MGTALTEDGYRFEHPTMSMVLSDMRIPRTDPGPGDMVPEFRVTTTDGATIDNADLRRDGRPTLLVFGSLTCPVTESAGGGLRQLHTRYGDQVRFVVINVREAHPGAATPQPQTTQQKTQHAVRLQQHHQLPFEVAADDLDGSMHRAFGPRPSSAYLVDPSGRITFRAHWSNLTEAIEDAVAAAASGHPAPQAAVGQTLRAMARMTRYAPQAFDTAGAGATRDTWKVAPPFAVMIAVAKLLRSRRRR